MFVYGGILNGHRDWVTALSCPLTNDSSIKLVSASRDKTLVAWKEKSRNSVEEAKLVPAKRLEGHSDFVSDVAISNTGEYAVSSSWDRSLRLWNLKTGECKAKFLRHEKDVCSVSFSPENRQIVSAGRDSKMHIWNVKGECMFSIADKSAHSDWINCIRFSPTPSAPLIVTGSSDQTVKVWSVNEKKCMFTLQGHKGAVQSVTVSPDGSLCASAGRDGKAKLWDLVRGEHLYELDCKEPISQVCFSPNRYWLCAATESRICVFDLESKDQLANLTPESSAAGGPKPVCTCLCWCNEGNILYSGYTDNAIRMWKLHESYLN